MSNNHELEVGHENDQLRWRFKCSDDGDMQLYCVVGSIQTPTFTESISLEEMKDAQWYVDCSECGLYSIQFRFTPTKSQNSSDSHKMSGNVSGWFELLPIPDVEILPMKQIVRKSMLSTK